jgi:hypothetical protein
MCFHSTPCFGMHVGDAVGVFRGMMTAEFGLVGT